MYNQIHRIIYLGAIIFLSTTFVFVACQTKENKGEAVTEEVSSVDNTTAEWATFKDNAEKSIANNNEKIRQIREKINKPGTPNIDKIREKRIDELESQNARLSAKVVEYKQNEMESDWEKFKSEVEAELNEMDQALKELEVK